MIPRKLLAVIVAALLLDACDSRTAAPSGDEVDIRPRWERGETLEVREEREHRRGSGRFPTEGEIARRSGSVTKDLDVYRETILEGSGPNLLRTRRTYVLSFQGPPDDRKPTPLMGKTYEITEPFADCRVEVKGEDGKKAPASSEETLHIRKSLLRIAASILPGQPVRVGSAWRPGRDLTLLATPDLGQARMTPRLASIEERDGRRVAFVECEWNVEYSRGRLSGTHITMQETLRMDLDTGRFDGYHAVTDTYMPPGRGRPEGWWRVVSELSVNLVER
jgi:hypothetical protein